MKKIIKFLFTISSILMLSVQLYAQTTQKNLEKYWLYRDRLKHFVVVDPNDKFGTNIPFWFDYWSDNNPGLTTGDGNDGIQYYIGMLATEYALLKRYGYDVTKTRNELLYALKAVERLDQFAENYFEIIKKYGNIIEHTEPNLLGIMSGTNDGENIGNPLPNPWQYKVDYSNDLNGFFVRDDIGEKFIDSLYSKDPNTYKYLNNYGKYGMGNVISTFVVGQGRNMPYEMSKDNVWHYLLNFALVKILVDDVEIQEKLVAITTRMMNNMHYKGCDLCLPTWKLKNPVTGFDVLDGADVEEVGDNILNQDGLSYGFAEAAYFITGKDLHYGFSNLKRNEFYRCLTNPIINTSIPKRAAHLMLATVGWNNDEAVQIEERQQAVYNAFVEVLTNSAHPVMCLNPPCPDQSVYLKSFGTNLVQNFFQTRLGKYCLKASEFQEALEQNYKEKPEGYPSFMRELKFNLDYPAFREPATYEHLPLIRFLIVNYQIKIKNNNVNALDIAYFNQDYDEYKSYYEQLLNEAPICGPINYGKNSINNPRVINWCMSNRLTLSASITELDEQIDKTTHIAAFPGRVKIDNEDNWGTFAGIDYMLLHNLYWLCMIPSNVNYIPNNIVSDDEIGEKIISSAIIKPVPSQPIIYDGHIIASTLPKSDFSYIASESIEFHSGFTIEKNCTFVANINNQWQYKLFNPSSLITTNSCYTKLKPFVP